MMTIRQIAKSAANLVVFIGYLGAQEADPVHILQFRSTHQYYRTAKYQLHRTTGDGDRRHCVPPGSNPRRQFTWSFHLKSTFSDLWSITFD